MKRQLMWLAASIVFAAPALSQTTIIDGSMNNGDLENPGDSTPFTPSGGSISTTVNHTSGGTQSLEIDLTANNARGQWKGIAANESFWGPGVAPGGLEAASTPGDFAKASAWIYIPSATTFGTAISGNPRLESNIEGFNTGSSTWGGLNYTFTTLTTLPRDEWVFILLNNVEIPADTTMIRTRPWNITSHDTVNGKDAFDWQDDQRTVPTVDPATPADWQTDGWDGVIYLDDIKLELLPPPPAGVGIEGIVNNGDMEAEVLAPFGTNENSASISTTFNNTPGGAQSMCVDLSIGTASTGRWKGLLNSSPVSISATAGDRIIAEAWVYIPSDVQRGTNDDDRLQFNLPIRSDNGGAGNGNIGATFNNLANAPRDTWLKYSTEAIAFDDVNPITSVSSSAFNIETQNDPGTLGYSGFVYFDDVVFKNIGPPPAVETLVGGEINNGDMEAVALAPFNPSFSSGSISTTINHTPEGSQSMCIDLSVGDSTTGRWKSFFNPGLTFPVEVGDQLSASLWVYVPSSAKLGPGDIDPNDPADDSPTSVVIEMRSNNGGAGNGQIGPSVSLDLTNVTRDTWTQLTGNWTAVDDVNPISSINTNAFYLASAQDLTEPVQANALLPGYEGFVYIDDVELIQTRPQGPDIQVTSVSYEDGVGVTIEYISQVGPVDVYLNDTGTNVDGGDFFLISSGETGGTYVDAGADASAVPKSFYVLVPENDPYPPAP
ncbi:MAG: hypothetical protein AAGB14_06390 [Verrucomicrobiota bacterium]